MENETSKEILGEKFKLFFDKGMAVHVKTKKESWFNGHILEVGSIFVILEEFKLGRKLIFYDEIFSVEHYVKEGEKKDGIQTM